jgi:hypothetical protein
MIKISNSLMTKENAHLYLPLIQALAEGKTIEYGSGSIWGQVNEPKFIYPPQYYRIKPEPTPDVVRNITVEATLKCGETCGEAFVQVFRSGKYIFPNLRLTFDGETGYLKTAEVI